MGFARSGIRQHWHVWEVLRDTSSQAATPALGAAGLMISTCVIIFLSLVAFIFWLGGLAEHAVQKSVAIAAPAGEFVTAPLPRGKA
jgi:cytochrome d ubiquinol oxidase subunit I